MGDSEFEELTQLYEELWEDGFWVKEWQGVAAVGDRRDIEHLAEKFNDSVENVVSALGMGECVSLSYPGQGATRVERIRDGWKQATTAREKGALPCLVEVREGLGLPVTDPIRLGTF
jgi:hypothetical protein